jgi:hypothetical protein
MPAPDPLAPTWRMLSRFARSPYLSVNWHGRALFRKGCGLMLSEQITVAVVSHDLVVAGGIYRYVNDAWRRR